MLNNINNVVKNLQGVVIGPGIGRDILMQDYMPDILKLL